MIVVWVRSVFTVAVQLVVWICGLLGYLADFISAPIAKPLCRVTSPLWRSVLITALLACSMGGMAHMPNPWWIAAAVLGLMVLVAVFRAWQRSEEFRDRILDRMTDADPDSVPDLLALNSLTAAFILPLFAVCYFRINGWIGGFIGDPSPYQFLLLSVDNLVDVVTLDIAGAFNLNLAQVAPGSSWTKGVVVLQKALLAFMFVGAAASLIKSRQAGEDSIKVLDTYPDLVLRLGSRGIHHLRRRLRGPPPVAPGADGILRLRPSAIYCLIVESVRSGDPPASTTALWIARRLRDRELLDDVNKRLCTYAAFFGTYRAGYRDRKDLEERAANAGARHLRFQPRRWTAEFGKSPMNAEEVYVEADIRDVCELFRYLEELHEPTPENVGTTFPLAEFLTCNSPAIRAASAAYAGNYAAYPTEAAPMAREVARALRQEVAPAPCLAQLRTLRQFGSRASSIVDASTLRLGDHNQEISRAAAAVLTATNDATAVGAATIALMLGHDDPYVSQCGASLIYESSAPEVIDGVMPYIDHPDEFVRDAVSRFLRDNDQAAGALKILRKLATGSGDSMKLALALSHAADALPTKGESIVLLKQVIAKHPTPFAVEHAIHTAQRIRAVALRDAIRRRLEEELAKTNPHHPLMCAAAEAAGILGDRLATPLLERMATGSGGPAMFAREALARLRDPSSSAED